MGKATMSNSDDRALSFPPFPPDYRASGLLLHVTSLPSAYGIGDVGPSALDWIDRLHVAGQSWWQALPLGPTGYGNSPYQPLSSFAGNELLVSPDSLVEDGLLRADDHSPHPFSLAVDYDGVIPFKRQLLEKAWANFKRGARRDLHVAFDEFRQAQHWLDDYGLFRALKFKHRGAYYLEWPAEFVQRVPAALTRARGELSDRIEQVCFAQFLLFRQGERLKKYAHEKGIRLIGDLPFFVSPDSSDVWANPELFLLDDHLQARFVAGVPPDYFTADGQLWGNPEYDWGPTGEQAFAGASIGCALCCRTSMRFGWITFVDSPRRGMCRLEQLRPKLGTGRQAPAPSFSARCSRSWEACHFLPRTWE